VLLTDPDWLLYRPCAQSAHVLQHPANHYHAWHTRLVLKSYELLTTSRADSVGWRDRLLTRGVIDGNGPVDTTLYASHMTCEPCTHQRHQVRAQLSAVRKMAGEIAS
jgi:hypothetical protein